MDNVDLKSLGDFILGRKAQFADAIFTNHFDSAVATKWHIEFPEGDALKQLKYDYVNPLLKLLINYCSSGNENIRAIYLDERLRYAPHRLDARKRREFHRELVARDSLFLVNSDQENKFKAAWDYIHQPLVNNEGADTVSLLAVGDCLLNELRVFLPHEFRQRNIQLDMRCMYFSSSRSGGFNSKEVVEYLKINHVDIIAVSFFTFDAMPGFRRFFERGTENSKSEIEGACEHYLDAIKVFIAELQETYSGTLLIHNVSGLPLGRWRKRIPFLNEFSRRQESILSYLNSEIAMMVSSTENTIMVDELSVAKSYGYTRSSRPVVSQKQYGGMFHTSCFGQVLSGPYVDIVNAYSRLSKCKVLLLDFDNTLWEGVMADGVVEHFRDKQQLLVKLQESGILLVAVSKNSVENIRWDEMTLQRDHFAAEKISWNSKVQSIREVSEELNLGLDSFVLIDDNRHERLMVENETEAVKCLAAEQDEVWRYLSLMLSFPCTKQTQEARQRTEMYRKQADRKKAISKVGNKSQMLEKLGLWYRFEKGGSSSIERVYELVSRTNQFNTTTKRYSKDQLTGFINADDSEIYIAHLGDQYGDLGLVGVVIVIGKHDSLYIDSFVMSCRAMGFGLEDQMLFEIVSAAARKYRSVTGRFIATDRNSPCAMFYSRHNFKAVDDETWRLELDDFGTIEPVAWLTKQH